MASRPCTECNSCIYEGLSKCKAQEEFFEDLPAIDLCLLAYPESPSKTHYPVKEESLCR